MRPLFVFALSLTFVPASTADFPYVRPNIDPAGIKGTLILFGDGQLPDSVYEQFVKKACSAEKGHIYYLLPPSMRQVEVIRLRSSIVDEVKKQGKKAEDFFVVPDGDVAFDTKGKATGVWIEGGADLRLAIGSEREKSCRKLLDRGSIVVGPANRVDRFLPGVKCDTGPIKSADERIAATLRKNTEHVGIHLAPKSAIIVTGRRIFAIGEGDVTIHLPKANGRPAFRKTLSGKRRYADLTALRRMAWERTQPPFPPKKLQPPTVDKGTLILIGGGGTPKGLLKRFVKSAGGKDACIVIFPTASSGPISTRSGLTRIFKDAGAKKVTVLPQIKLADVESPAFLKTLREATGIWFGGGRQWRFVDAYYGTKAHEAMFDVLKRGGVIAGSSAGASIQAEYLARGDPLGNLNIISPGYERGLGFLKGVAVDQHFSQRKRQRDMSLLVKTHPQLLGIGIDETTAIVVQGSVAEVVGKGRVFFYDSHKKNTDSETDYHAVASGGRYDLRMRKELTPVESK